MRWENICPVSITHLNLLFMINHQIIKSNKVIFELFNSLFICLYSALMFLQQHLQQYSTHPKDVKKAVRIQNPSCPTDQQ